MGNAASDAGTGECAVSAGRKHKRTNSGKSVRRNHSHRASGSRAAAPAQKISPHRLENAASPRIRAVHTVTEDVIDVFDFGLQNLFKEERQPTKSLIADDKAPMGLDILFDEDRQDSESFGLDVLFGEAPYPDIDDDWVMEFGLSELFNDGAEDAAAKRPWTATEVAWMAATGAAVAVPLFFWTIRDCTRAGYRNIKRIVMR